MLNFFKRLLMVPPSELATTAQAPAVQAQVPEFDFTSPPRLPTDQDFDPVIDVGFDTSMFTPGWTDGFKLGVLPEDSAVDPLTVKAATILNKYQGGNPIAELRRELRIGTVRATRLFEEYNESTH